MEIRPLVNHSQEYQSTNTVPKMASVDFDVLTLVQQSSFERWIFPKDFNQSIQKPLDSAPLHIGRMVRFLPMSSISDSITVQDPIHSSFDYDQLCKATRIFEEKAFFEDLKKGEPASTELSYQSNSEKILLHLHAGSGSLKFEVEEEQVRFTPSNDLLNEMILPR